MSLPPAPGSPDLVPPWNPAGESVDPTPATHGIAPATDTQPIPAAPPATAPDAGAMPVAEVWTPPAIESTLPAPAHPGPTGPKAPGSRPGWVSVIAVAAAMMLPAAAVGGILGAWLANSGRLTLGRSAYEPPAAQPGTTARPEGSIASIAAKALPSVVTIHVTDSTGEGTGSGWVFDSLGHIVTNNHVVDSAASGGKITVVLTDGTREPATIVGRDTSYDLAVLKVTGVKLAPLPIGRSGDVVVGDEVIAVGAPLGLQSTVTAGIISALDRPVSTGDGSSQSFINAIQTDAAINPGNSGGPLLDLQGRVIGVNSAIARVPSGDTSQAGNIGVGFAIPSDQVRKTVAQLISRGKAQHPVIGVMLDRSYDGAGVRIAAKASGGDQPVTAGGPADKAGLKAGDIILAFDGKPVVGADEFVVAIRARDVGDDVRVTVRRGDKQFDVTMTLQAADSP